jgi:KDO2-lipid IV(A) lauroyltransferase
LSFTDDVDTRRIIMFTVKSIRNSLLYYAARFFFGCALLLPRTAGLHLFGAIGSIVFLFPNREKRRTLDHLGLIYGDKWSREKIKSVARKVYVMLGKNMFDAVYLSRASQERFNALVKHDDLSPFREAYGRGNGVIVITAHVGCFEMLLHFFARQGFRSFAVGRRMFDSRIEGLLRKVRSGEDIEYMGRDEGPVKVVRRLKEGKAFGVLIDQDIRVESVFADFLGRPAHTPCGPLKIAMKLDIPVVVATTSRQPDNTHYVFLSKPLELADTGDFNRDLVENVQTANDLISETIKCFPDQWVWMHRRWKRQPNMP